MKLKIPEQVYLIAVHFWALGRKLFVGLFGELGLIQMLLCLQRYEVTTISEGLRPPQNRRFCVVLKIRMIMFNTPKSEVILVYAKTQKSEGLRPTQKLKNLRFCVVLKIWIIMFNISKSEVILSYAKTPKLEGLHPPQKLQNRRFCVVLKILMIMFNTPKSEVILLCAKTPKSEGLGPQQKLQNWRFCIVLK